MKYHYIYLIKNKVNRKIYIGKHSTSNLNDNYFGSGKLLKYAINKYGVQNFSIKILEHCKQKDLNEKETLWIEKMNTTNPNGYNLTFGGDGGNTYELLTEEEKIKFRKKSSLNNKNKIVSKETCLKISKANKGHSRNKGISKSEKTKQKMKEAWKKRRVEKPMTEETRKKISKANKGKKRSKESCEKMALTWLGRHHTVESNEKNRQSHLGKKHSKESILKIKRKYSCKYCGKEMNVGNLNRWHNENCKFKNHF